LLHKIKRFLLAPLIYGAAILLLFEEWLWHASKRVLARLPLLAFIVRLEAWISSLSPYAALAIFLAPSLLLIPVKILALLSITHGHATTGVVIVLLAKVLGTALVARLYSLTNTALSSLAWFVRWREALLRFKDRMIAHLRATAAWQQVEASVAALVAARKRAWDKLRHCCNSEGQSSRIVRIIRKLAARWRERR